MSIPIQLQTDSNNICKYLLKICSCKELTTNRKNHLGRENFDNLEPTDITPNFICKLSKKSKHSRGAKYLQNYANCVTELRELPHRFKTLRYSKHKKPSANIKWFTTWVWIEIWIWRYCFSQKYYFFYYYLSWNVMVLHCMYNKMYVLDKFVRPKKFYKLLTDRKKES